MKFRALIPFFSLLALLGCTFVPQDSYFADVNKTPPDPYTINLNDLGDQDTIHLYQAPVILTFQISAVQFDPPGITVLLGPSVILTTTQNAGSFTLDPSVLGNGTFHLRIQFSGSSGTGSLADKLSTEKITHWKSWTVIVDQVIPPKPVVQLSSENGFLKVSWTGFSHSSFLQYDLYINRYYSARHVIILKPDVTSFIDSGYYGGVNAHYQVVTTSKAGSGPFSDDQVIVDAQEVTATNHPADSTVALSWKKPLYPAAFGSVVISETTVTDSITDANQNNDMVKLKDIALGRSSFLTVVFKPKYANSHTLTIYKEVANPLGAPRIGHYQSYYYSQSLGSVMGWDGIWFRTYNSTMQAVDSVSLSSLFSFPYPGRLIYTLEGNGFRVMNLIDHTSIVKQTLIYGSTYFPPRSLSGADNEIVSYRVKDLSFPMPDDPGSFRSETDNLVNSHIISPYFYSLSDDGHYAQDANAVYQLSNETFTYLWSSTFPQYKFRPDNNDEMISVSTPTTIVSTIDKTVLRTISPPDPGYRWLNYDPATRTLLYVKDGATKVYMINIDTQQVKSVQAIPYVLMNGFLFDIQGYYIKVL